MEKQKFTIGDAITLRNKIALRVESATGSGEVSELGRWTIIRQLHNELTSQIAADLDLEENVYHSLDSLPATHELSQEARRKYVELTKEIGLTESSV